MLRLIVLTLLLANGVYLAWGQGWLLPYGFGPVAQHEPQRLAQQIRPGALELITDKEALLAASPASAAALRTAVCLQSGVLDEAKADALRRALQLTALPEGSWTLDVASTPGRWIIYMGKYANAADMAKKRAQLANLRLTFEPIRNPALTPGLSLGGYPSEEAANAGLQALALRGVRTARVMQEVPATQGYLLRLPAVDEAVQKQLAPIRTALAGQPLEPCLTPR